MIRQVIAAVPARNEAPTIASCIASLDSAAASTEAGVSVVVAADSCTDSTVDLAKRAQTRHCHVTVIEGTWGAAGAARQAAVAVGLAALDADHTDLKTVWIANTDADTVVSPTWISDQLRLARTYDALAGVVALDRSAVHPHLFAQFNATYRYEGERHGHVHGANLGVRADAYLAAGGWCPNTGVGEDHGLWGRLLDAGARVLQTTGVLVTTSGRTSSRVDGGFATNLRRLVTPNHTSVDGPVSALGVVDEVDEPPWIEVA